MSIAAILGMVAAVSFTLVASAAVWLRRKYYRIYNGLE
jgi:hypothetical protein